MLYNLFMSVAPVQSCRVCRHAITRQSLGYAYVNFHTTEDAERVLDTMNFQDLHGRQIRIMWSQRDPSVRRSGAGNVFVKNLSTEMRSSDLLDLFSSYGNVLSCKVAFDYEKGVSKGYGFVQFDSDDSAASAIEDLNGKELEGQRLTVTKYVRRADRQKQNQFTNLYVKNVPKDMPQDELIKLFEKHGPIAKSTQDLSQPAIYWATDASGDFRGFAFIAMENHEDARNAIEELNGKELPHKIQAKATDEVITKNKPLYVGRAMKKIERERLLRDQYEKKKLDMIRTYQGRNLYVRNLDESMTEEALQEAFKQFGEVESARIMRDTSGRSKLFGFVCFSNAEDAQKACGAMFQQMVQGKPLYVSMWQPRELRRAEILRNMQQGRMSGPFPRAGVMPGMDMNMAMMMRGINPAYVNPMMRGAQMPPYGTRGFQEAASGGRPRGRGGRRGAGRAGGPSGRFQSNARNVPDMAMQPQMMPMMPQQMVQQMPPQQMVPHQQQPLHTELATAPESERRTIIGEKLYHLIHASQPALAGKITGMLLEGVDIAELLHLLETPQELSARINEALEVLNQAGGAAE